MAHTRHRKKTLRNAAKKRLDNRSKRSSMRTAVKKAEEAIEADPAGADAALAEASKRIDKAAKLRLIHPNKAARTKSRLARTRNRAGSA